MEVVVGGAIFIVGLLASVIAIWQVVWPFFKRRILMRPDPQPATTRHIDTLAQQIKDLESKVTLGSEYLDGLPEAVNEKLRAAYQEARILQLEGDQAQSAEKHREAIDRFTRALELAETDSQRAALHNLRGNSYYFISQYKEAEADYQDTLKLAERISPAEDAAQARSAALGNLGVVCAERGDLEKAEEHHKQAMEIHRKMGNRLGEANQLSNLGGVYLRRGELDEAEDHFKKALKIHRKIGDRPGEATVLGNLGLAYRRRGEMEKAEEHFKLALKIYGDIGNRLGEANALGNLGLVYTDRGDLEKAEEHHKQALEIAREIGNRLSEASALGNLGIVYAQRSELEKAEEHLKQALEIQKEIGDRLHEANQLGNLGIVYGQRNGPGDLDKAEEHFKQALDIAREVGDRLGEAAQLDNLGNVYLQRSELKKAREYLRQAQAIYHQIGAGGEGPKIVRQALELIAEQEREQAERGE